MKVFISSGNAPGQGTGYGQQVTHIMRALRKESHEIIVCGWSMILPRMAFKMIPWKQAMTELSKDLASKFSAADHALFADKTYLMVNPLHKWPALVPKDVLNHMLRLTQSDLLIAFQDIFVFGRGPFVCPSMVWMPLHFMPLEHKTFYVLDDFTDVVAMTHYGRELLARSFQDPAKHARAEGTFFYRRPLDYAPHGCDLDIFRPLEGATSPDALGRAAAYADRAELRRRLGWPEDAFVGLIIAANTEGSNRKAFDTQLQAWARFAHAHRRRTGQRAYLHVHTKNDGEMDLPRLLEMYGLHDGHARAVGDSEWGRTACGPEGPWARDWSMTPPARYGALSQREIVQMYQAADVLLAASCAEGFGVPIIEAQLCGCPVITNWTTSMMELTRFGRAAGSAQVLFRNDFCTGWQQPDPVRLARAMREVAAWDPARRAELLRAALPLLRARYAAATVEEAWTRIARKWAARMDLAKGTVDGVPAPVNAALAVGKQARDLYLRQVHATADRAKLEQTFKELTERARANRDARALLAELRRPDPAAASASSALVPTAPRAATAATAAAAVAVGCS